MDKWIAAALRTQYIEKVDSSAVTDGVFGEAFVSSLYDGHVVFDWALLHRRMKPSGVHPFSSPAVEQLRDFGWRQLAKDTSGAAPLFITVVEVKEPWALQPLSEAAQNLSIFEVSPTALSSTCNIDTASGSKSTPACTEKHQRHLFRFKRGPPGLRAVRDDIVGVLRSIEDQLTSSGLTVFYFLSSFILLHADFTTLLHQTAAVHKALRDAGLCIDGHGCCLAPGRLFPLRVHSVDWWVRVPLSSLKTTVDIASYSVALMGQWLQDSYVWGCSTPIRVFSSSGSTVKEGGCDATVWEIQVRLFERFVRGVVLPGAAAIGFDGLRAEFLEESGDLFEVAREKLREKEEPVGPQRWSPCDLRLTLCQLGAYRHDPVAFLSAPTLPI